ncbi:hypothetical protein BGX23_007096 [Mortierella sp. AD031]|nr:hypothetical protein BGX23_007096 [Mortierella sp. AD031]
MFWKKQRASDLTLQLQDMTESPPMGPFATSTSASSPKSDYTPMAANLAEIDQPSSPPPKSFSSKKSAPIPPAVAPINPCSFAQRRYFNGADAVLTRAKTLSINGRAESPRFRHQPEMCAHLPEKTSAFKFFGSFKNYGTGHYTVHWRVKVLQDFYIPNGLHFVVKIMYDTEPDISGSLDVILPAHKLNTLGKDQWYNLTLEEKVVIQPHEGWANVQVMLLNNENEDRDEYSGFLVEHVEVRPMGVRTEYQPGVRNMIVQRASVPVMVVDTTRAFPKTQDFSYFPSDAPITRLAFGKKSRFMASLGLSRDVAYITVWDIGIIRNPSNPSRNMAALYKGSATFRIHHPGVGELAIGLAISASGDQVAVFEEPKVGQWLEGSEAPKPSFKFKLFDNPLVPKVSITLDMDAPPTSNVDEKGQESTGDNRSGRGRHTSSNSVNSPGTPTVGGLLLEEVGWEKEHEILSGFLGFGEFVPGIKKNEWENNDLGTLTSSIDENDESAGKDGKDSNNKNGSASPNNGLFVTCNGIYIDVYEISPERRWKRLHTITITDLIPTLSRRITCKMMMDSISSNNFMWLEDGGRSCTIWNLLTGSNITHISSIENALFKGPTFRGHSKMAISPHESIVALASVDGSLTTYFANTGMAIDDRKFPGYKIEYVGFQSQDDKLMVILRDSVTFELVAKSLDTLQLKSETIINQTPIPAIGTILHAFFNIRGYYNRGLVIEADGTKINCYISSQPSSSKVIKTSDTVLQSHPADVLYESQYDDHIQYRLQTAYHRELLPEGDGVFYWVHRVEVIREDLKERTQRLIFSFIPEPWMRATTAEVSHPENLLTAFFVPCGTRFAVNGTQTLQIWNLPTHENSKCSLQYIWSQPRGDEDLAPGGIAHQSSRVRDYYVDTMDTTIFLDRVTGNTVAEIRVNDKSKKRAISIPGPGTIGAHYAILYCFRSIHLLAAAYAYSHRESKKASRDAQQSFTFEDHAEAILRFTREHINRMMSIGAYLPGRKPGNNDFKVNNAQRRRAQERNRALKTEKLAVSPDPIPILPGIVNGTSDVGLPVAAAPRMMGDVTIHGNSNRRQAEVDDDRPDPIRVQDTIQAHEFVQPRDFIQAMDFVQARDFDFIVRTPKKPPSSNHPQIITVLTLLLDQKYLRRTNHLFVQGLLNSANGDWIPRDNSALNPIRRAIESRNAVLVEAFIDYCILNAKKYHPAYLMPAVQCLNELSERYPAILADMFRKASYVPAHNYAYVSSHALVANPQYTELVKFKMMFWNYFSGKSFEKSNDINDYDKPVFSLRSQLPFRSTSFLNVLNIETSLREKRHGKFPPKRETVDEDIKKSQSNKDYKIYVTPFPKLSMYGPYKPWYQGLDSAQSAFTDIAGEDYFDSPAMVATLQFKWHKFGFQYWFVRFMVVFIFFLLIVVITAQQIAYSSDANLIANRYMDSWHPVITVAIAFGAGLCGYELMQFIYAPTKYIRSPYNYLDLVAYVLPIVGCIMLMKAEVGTFEPPAPQDRGPKQIWVMSFAILCLYFNILFELRVVRQLGIVVNIIWNITKSIAWFFLIFVLILIGFTHALMHLLHTHPYRPSCPPPRPSGPLDPSLDYPDPDQDCIEGEQDTYPNNFFRALSATYFFLSGRYDPVEVSLGGTSVSFHIMMILFFFISAILFLNILIALMNDAFNESKDQGQLAWLKQWSEVIAEVEIFLMTQNTRQNRNYFPDYIYYGANEQEAELYESKFFIASKSNLSIENRFLIDTVSVEQHATQLTQRQVLRDVQTLSRELDRLKSNQEGFNQDIIRLTEVVAAYLASTAPPAENSGGSSDGEDDDDGSSSSSSSELSPSPVENDPPTSGVSMGEGQSTGPPSPPVPSPPPPTAVPGGTISLPSPATPAPLPSPPALPGGLSRASSAPIVPTVPAYPDSSSRIPPPPAPPGSRPPYPSFPSSSTPYSAPGSAPYPSYPGSSPYPAPSYPGSAPTMPVPVQTSAPMPPMPIPLPPAQEAQADEMPVPPPPMDEDWKASQPDAFEDRKSSRPDMDEDRKSSRPDMEEDRKSSRPDMDEDRKSSRPDMDEENMEDPQLDMDMEMDEEKIEEENEGYELESESSGGEEVPAPPPPVPAPPRMAGPIRPSTRPAPASSVPFPSSSPQPPVSAPASSSSTATPIAPGGGGGGRRFKKISPGAETTDSPTTYTPTTGRHNPPPISTVPPPTRKQGRQTQTQPRPQVPPPPPVVGQLPAGGPAIYHPDIGSSTKIPSSTSAATPRYKVIELQDPEPSRPTKKTSHTHIGSSLRQRVQKVVAVQTVDEALRAHRRIEDNNVSHPVYVVHQPAPPPPTSSSSSPGVTAGGGGVGPQQRRYRRYSDDGGLDDDDDDEDEDEDPENEDDHEDEGHSTIGSTHSSHHRKGKSVRSSTAPTLSSQFTTIDEIQTLPYSSQGGQGGQQQQHHLHRPHRLPHAHHRQYLGGPTPDATQPDHPLRHQP